MSLFVDKKQFQQFFALVCHFMILVHSLIGQVASGQFADKADNFFCQRKEKYCRTANFRVQENFANFAKIRRFAKISCMLILPDQRRGLKLSLGFYRIKIGQVEVSFLVLTNKGLF